LIEINPEAEIWWDSSPLIWMNLIRCAHNWNVGIAEQWNDGFWKNGMMASPRKSRWIVIKKW
jgi:hypothetical protein